MRNRTFIPFILAITAFAALILSFSLVLSTNAQLSAQQNTPSYWMKKYRHIDPETGLRTAYYRAALPKSVPGGTRINLKQAHVHFLNKTAIFLDVMAHTGTGPDPIDGNWRLSVPRNNIPNSIWLADVGTGTLRDELKNYFKSNLIRITKGDKTKPIIIYCTADCWMAWNAVQRASKWGYTNLFWFPEGSDEWRYAGYPLEKALPVPVIIED